MATTGSLKTQKPDAYLFPGTGFVEDMGVGVGRGYSVNLPLFPNTGDNVYLWTMEQVVLPLVANFRPDVLATQLGIDTHVNDPLAHLALTSGGYTKVVQLLGELGRPWLAFGGGGYDMSVVSRCWALAYGVMTGREWPNEVPQSYRDRYGVSMLRDSGDTVEDEFLDSQMGQYAQETVAEVVRTIFPLHGL